MEFSGPVKSEWIVRNARAMRIIDPLMYTDKVGMRWHVQRGAMYVEWQMDRVQV